MSYPGVNGHVIPASERMVPINRQTGNHYLGRFIYHTLNMHVCVCVRTRVCEVGYWCVCVCVCVCVLGGVCVCVCVLGEVLG